jgi:8-oxo-dGTP diphosphatase
VLISRLGVVGRLERFTDKNGIMIDFSKEASAFGVARHVLVVCRYLDQWVLTDHKLRGFEFPGGKVESGETITEAAKREVFEETGGIVKNVLYLGQYRVNRESDPFIKSVYFAQLETMVEKDNYMETNGPVFLRELCPPQIRNDSRFSFIMKDEILPLSLESLRSQYGGIT